MTVSNVSFPSGPLRTAGVLFVVSGVASATALGLEQYASTIVNPPDTFGSLIYVVLAFGALELEAIVLLAAYIALYFLKPRGRLHWLFLLAALGHVIDALRIAVPAAGLFGEVIAVVGTVGAGVYVLSRRLFTPVPSVIYFVAVVVGLVGIILPLVTLAIGLEDVILYITAALYVASGIAMIFGARAKTRSTATE